MLVNNHNFETSLYKYTISLNFINTFCLSVYHDITIIATLCMCISYINIAIMYAYNWLAKMLSVYHIADFCCQ